MRVIQDSDDEFEEEIDVNLPSHAADNAPDQRVSFSSAGPESGSTESLRRAFLVARRDHLQATPVTSIAQLQDGPPSSVSLPDQYSRTDMDVAKLTTLKPPSEIRFHETSTKHYSRPASSPNQPLQDTVQLANQQSRPSSDTLRNCKDKRPGVFAKHESMTPFPEPSSTVPNATLTQQRVLETVAAPAFLGMESELGIAEFQPVDHGSVPWSDLMKFSPDATVHRSITLDQQTCLSKAPIRMSQMSQEQCSLLPASPSRHREASVVLIGSPLADDSHPADADPLQSLRPTIEPLSSPEANITTKTSKAPQDFSKGSSRGKYKKTRASISDHSDDEIIAVGVSNEQYKPRSSRPRPMKHSGSAQVDVSINSNKPSKVTRSRTCVEQSCSQNVSEGRTWESTPQKIRQICDMGFTPSSTKKALKKNYGDINQTVEWLIRNNLGEDELAHRGPSTRKAKSESQKVIEEPRPDTPRTTKLSAGQVEAFDNMTDQHHIVTNEQSDTRGASRDSHAQSASSSRQICQTKSPKVQVIIPLKSEEGKSPKRQLGDGSQKQPKRRKTTSDIPEAVPELPLDKVQDKPSVSSISAGKKRGRGRPRKAEQAAMQINKDESQPATMDQGAVSSAKLQATEAEPEMQHRGRNEPDEATKARKSPIAGTPTEEPTPTSKPTTLQTEDLRNPGTLQQSSLTSSGTIPNKSRAIYRVGLSKRARIAPLLRTLKK